MRSIHSFNDDWLFVPEQVDDTAADSLFETVTLPHSNKIFPHHNFDNHDYQFVSTYRKRFQLPEALNGRRLYLDFDGAMIAATVSINGHTFEEHKGGYTPFSFDITDYINEGGENLLTVHLDSSERKDIPPYGYVVDYLTFGGIYRDVHLRYVEPVHIADVFVKTFDVLTDHPRVQVDVTIKNQSSENVSAQLSVLINEGKIQDDGSVNVIAQEQPMIEVEGNNTLTTSIEFRDLQNIELWTLDNPVRYGLGAELHLPDGEVDDNGAFPFGFRQAEFRDDSFYLNGERLQLRGLNRHQTYPYIGAAAPKRLQEKDADIVKYELGCNIVRTSHYPQSPHFLNRCDEIGLLVFEEIPGWQHIGDEDWQTISMRDVRAMLERDRNHPSIILWGVRINESGDSHDFYLATNKLAHELDPTRQTGGVRYVQDSEFTEDVFTFNDFSNGVVEPVHTPYMITEFNGHMFPTKSWDNEERQVEHAVRHAKIQAQAATTGGVSGAIGWCAFDYNTHREFGSGDRICYHGVMDIFRLPKYAAHFYGSQQSPKQNIILQPATIWTMGDRSVGGNDPLVVFSNCDEIEAFIGEQSYGRFLPDKDHYPGLPHPPFTVTNLGKHWGEAFDDLRIVGYLAGEQVIERCIDANGIPHKLVLEADDTALQADGADMTRLIFKIVDRFGNRLPYTNQVISFDVEGSAEFIGESPFALMGGQAALYIKATKQTGQAVVRASTPGLNTAEVTITFQ